MLKYRGSSSLNKLDRMGADFYRVIDQVKTVLGAKPLVMTLPIGREEEFVGVVDVLTEGLRMGRFRLA